MHLPLFLITLWLWFRTVRLETDDERVASWATILMAVSPMLILTTATALSHAGSLFCMVAAGYGYSLTRHERPVLGATIAGLALGFSVAVRVQVALPFGVILGLAVLWEISRRRRWLALGALAVTTGSFALAVALYNLLLTGSVTTLPWSLSLPQEHWGFGAPLDAAPDYRHTFTRAIQNQLSVLVRLNGWFLGWPLSLGLLAVWYRLGRPLRGAHLWLIASLGLIVFNFCYYSPGVSDTGSLYHYELILPFALLGGHTISRAVEIKPRLVLSILVVHIVLGSGWFLAEKSLRLERFPRSGRRSDRSDASAGRASGPGPVRGLAVGVGTSRVVEQRLHSARSLGPRPHRLLPAERLRGAAAASRLLWRSSVLVLPSRSPEAPAGAVAV